MLPSHFPSDSLAARMSRIFHRIQHLDRCVSLSHHNENGCAERQATTVSCYLWHRLSSGVRLVTESIRFDYTRTEAPRRANDMFVGWHGWNEYVAATTCRAAHTHVRKGQRKAVQLTNARRTKGNARASNVKMECYAPPTNVFSVSCAISRTTKMPQTSPRIFRLRLWRRRQEPKKKLLFHRNSASDRCIATRIQRKTFPIRQSI